MESVSAGTATTIAPPRRWPFFLFGVLLFVLGPVVYAVQVGAGQLRMPWYVLILMSIGVLLMIVSVWQRRGIWRSATLVLFVLLCGCFWYFALVLSKTPLYVGPAQPGSKVPAFSTVLADGKPISNGDLETGGRSVLLFFRGRW